MRSDLNMRTTFETMLDEIAAPPVPLSSILHALARPSVAPRATGRLARLAIAAAIAAALVVALPTISPALVASLGSVYDAALRAAGVVVPPPVARTLARTIAPHFMTLAKAQAMVPFTIVGPSGLPANVASSSISTAPSAIYDTTRHVWTKGIPFVQFTYKRTDGRTFGLIAERFDARVNQRSLYTFEPVVDGVNGNRGIEKHRNYKWRNGDQEMSAVEGHELSGAEILAIITAMRGTPLHLTDERFHPGREPAKFRILRLAP